MPASEPDIGAVAATTTAARDALALVRRIRSEAVMLDYRLPDEDGLSLGLAPPTCLE